MKKFLLQSSLAILLGIFFVSPTSLAASNPATYFPAEVPYYLELDANQQHPFKNMLKDLLMDNLELDTNSDETAILLKNIDKTKLAIGFMDGRINAQPIMLAAFNLEPADFDQLIKSEQVDISDLGSGKKVYQIGEGFYFTYLGGNIVGSNEFGLISDLLLTKNSNNLFQSVDFQNFQKNINNEGFLKAFINIEKAFSSKNVTTEQVAPFLNLTNLLKIEGINLQQNSSGFNGEVYLEFSPDSNYPISDLLFVPEIYKKINSNKLFLYQESYNLNSQINLLPKTLGLGDEMDFLGEFKTNLKNELGINWDTEIAPLIQKRTAISIHENNQIIPAISLVTEVGNSATVQSTNEKLVSKLTEIFNQEVENSYQTYLEDQSYLEEYYPQEFQPTISKEEFIKEHLNISKSSNNGKFTTLTLSTHSHTSTGLPALKFSLTLGTTNDGYWVITSGDLSELFNINGLLADSEFSKNYQNRSQKVTDISFINFPSLKTYLVNLDKTVSGKAEGSLSEELSLFLDPLKNIYSETISLEGKSIKSNIKVNLDITKMSNYQTLFDKLMESNFIDDLEDFDAEEIATAIEFNPEHCLSFQDVQSNDWFSTYVTDICFNNIMNGFGSEFKPNQAITRAEFIKTVMAAQDYLGYFYTTVEPQTYFSDVNVSDWYAAPINRARAHHVVDGFTDNTFRPNQPITRAEAMQIIYNLNEHATPFNNPNFQDVATTDWFYPAVAYGKAIGIISGKTNNNFAPSDNLTRAETAKIIQNYLSN